MWLAFKARYNTPPPTHNHTSLSFPPLQCITNAKSSQTDLQFQCFPIKTPTGLFSFKIYIEGQRGKNGQDMVKKIN